MTPRVIGITGRIGCGKSTVMQELARLGAETIDADQVYRDLVQPGAPLLAQIAARFGAQSIGPDGMLDRDWLRGVVFTDPAALAALERLTHPAVVAEVERRIAASEASAVAIDAVKLAESGLAARCDDVWLVACTPAQQRQRIMQRNAISAEEADRRIAAQPDVSAAERAATFTIDNSGPVADTLQQVRDRWQSLQAHKMEVRGER